MTGRVQQLREVPGPPPAPIPLRPPRRRRSKLLILVGIVLSAVSATGTVWLFNATDDAVPAVGVARPVRYGETITADSLREVRVRPDPGVRPLTWEQRSDLVGRTSPTDLLPGGIVTSEVLSATADIPAPDQQLVGVPVKAGQLPVTALEPRRPVLLVPAGAAPDSWGPVHGSVVTVGPRDSSTVQVVDVVVPAGSGPQLATRAAILAMFGMPDRTSSRDASWPAVHLKVSLPTRSARRRRLTPSLAASVVGTSAVERGGWQREDVLRQRADRAPRWGRVRSHGSAAGVVGGLCGDVAAVLGTP